MREEWVLFATEAGAVERDEDDITYVGFSSETEGRRSYCTFSRMSHVGEVYVEIEDQKWGCYDGIERLLLNQNEAIVVLNDKGRAVLEVPVLRIVFGADVRGMYVRVEKVLKDLLADKLLSAEP